MMSPFGCEIAHVNPTTLHMQDSMNAMLKDHNDPMMFEVCVLVILASQDSYIHLYPKKLACCFYSVN